MTNRFGDSYLAPWKKSDGQSVSGDTNRLVIAETDLTIPGKNGLDVVIRRKHDNQYYNRIYSAYRRTTEQGNVPVYQLRNIYAFKNSDTNATVYVGFMTEDDYHTYMENGITISSLPTKSYNIKHNDKTIKMYCFENIYSKKER